MSDLMSFGGRLRSARREANLNVKWMVDYINGFLIASGYKAIDDKTYYSWECIGTAKERPGRRYPHPMLYRVIIIPLGITGYWLMNGDAGGRIIRRRQDIKGIQDLDYDQGIALEQIAAVGREDELFREFRRVIGGVTPAQRSALMLLLKSIR